MVKVNWTPENDRKLLLQLIIPASKDIPIDYITTLFPGATQKSITERIAKLRREKKASTGTGTTPTTTPTKSASAKTTTTMTPSPLSAKTVSDPSWTGGSQNPGGKNGAAKDPFLSVENAPRGRKRGAVKGEDEEGPKGRKRGGVKHQAVKQEEEESKKITVEIDDDDDDDEEIEEEKDEGMDEDLDEGLYDGAGS